MTDFDALLKFFISSLIGGGTGLVIIVYLSKNLINQLLKKDLTKYKTELSYRLKFDQDVMKFNYGEETKVITEIWGKIEELVSCCAKFEEGKDEENLNALNKELKKNLSKNLPFIHSDLEKAIIKLLEHSDYEKYSPDKYSTIDDTKSRIIIIIRNRFQLYINENN